MRVGRSSARMRWMVALAGTTGKSFAGTEEVPKWEEAEDAEGR